MNTQAFELLKSMLEKIDHKIGSLEVEFREHGKILAENTSSLKEHIRRTELLEETVNLFKAQLDIIHEQHELHKQRALVKPTFKQLAGTAAAVTAIITLITEGKQFIIDVVSALLK